MYLNKFIINLSQMVFGGCGGGDGGGGVGRYISQFRCIPKTIFTTTPLPKDNYLINNNKNKVL